MKLRGVPCQFSKESFYKQVEVGLFTEEDEEEFTPEEVDELLLLGINIFPLYQQLELIETDVLNTLVKTRTKEELETRLTESVTLEEKILQLNLFAFNDEA